MSTQLCAAMVGFDITPRFHPEFGAWGTSPEMTEIDMPLLARCLVIDQNDRRMIWFGSDLVGATVAFTNSLRDQIAGALGMKRNQIIWSTSQTHAGGAMPGSDISGSCIGGHSDQAKDFIEAEHKRLMKSYIDTAVEAIDRLQPVRIWAGRGYCDSISYNTRFPMPAGGCKLSRNYREGLQSGKYFDPTIGLVRFEDEKGRPIGSIFNFCCHPAVLILQKYISPDYVGTARQYIEDASDGAPAMFLQGFCGDVHNYHMFGTPELAKRIGARLGKAAAESMRTLVPVRSELFAFDWKNIELQCQPMLSREKLEDQIVQREAFIEELKYDPQATWLCGVNVPEQLTPEQRADFVRVQIAYLKKSIQMIDAGEKPGETLDITLGAMRIGDVGFTISPGENFTKTGQAIRTQSPFVHTLICGDTNGLFGYIGNDEEIDRGGYETDSYWKMLHSGGERVRLPLAKGSVKRIINTSLELLRQVHEGEIIDG